MVRKKRLRHFGPVLSPQETSALIHVMDVSPMPSVSLGLPKESERLYAGYSLPDEYPGEIFDLYDIKRGLRNADGSGVLVGLTGVSSVIGYERTENGPKPVEGDLILRGYHLDELVNNVIEEDRFGYEEMAYLLISGVLPTEAELDDFQARIDSRRELPDGYLSIFPRTTASYSVMNVIQRATLLLYAFDPNPDDTSATHEVDVAISLLSRLPRIAAVATAAATADKNGERLVVPPVREGYCMAETILDVLRGDAGYTREEARLLDIMLMLHAEHGGGNNSTFSCRVLSSSGTDAYSSYAAAMGSLKGPKHGGANAKVGQMIEDAAHKIANWGDDDEVRAYLEKIARKEAFDKTGLVYGMGHAVYTLSDPRARLVKGFAHRVAREKGCEEKLELIESIERLTPEVMRDVRNLKKPLCANIDLYTGFIYSMLGIPRKMHTPIFAIARMAGWAAHRMEELYGANRIIRPAYRSMIQLRDYVPLAER